MTTLEAIYENGIFKPVSTVPGNIKEHERVTINIETDSERELLEEFAQWEAASDEDERNFSREIESEIEKPSVGAGRKKLSSQSASRIVDETFGLTKSIKRNDLISLAEDEEFCGY